MNNFLKGFMIGFSIAAVVGPIALLCIRRTLVYGRLSGLASGLGAALGDAFYGAVAGFGLTIISNFLLAHQNAFRFVGGLFLCYLGITTFLSKPPTYLAISLGLIRSRCASKIFTLCPSCSRSDAAFNNDIGGQKRL